MTNIQRQITLPKAGDVFTKAGNRFIDPAGGLTLYLHHRKEYTQERPRLYLMYAPQGSQTRYLTGLYPQPDGTFIGEKNGVYWRVSVTDYEIAFKAVNEGKGVKVPSSSMGLCQLKGDAL